MPAARNAATPRPLDDHALRWLLGLYLVSALVIAVQRLQPPPEYNFLIFRAAFHHLRAGQNLYAAYPAEYADYFKYSPTFALLFAPFALLPIMPAYMLWAVLCAGVVFWAVTRLLPPRQAALALAIAWLAVVGDLQRAQTNALCAGLMILGWVAMERDRQWPAAIAIVAGAFVKLFPAAALAGVVFHRRKGRFAIIVGTAIAIGALLPLLATSWHSLMAQYHWWGEKLREDSVPMARYGTSGAGLYAGLMGQFRVWWGVQWPFWPTQLAGLAILLAPLARGPRAWSPKFRIDFLASMLVFCVLFNHQAESPSYSIAMIGAAVWFAASERGWWRAALIAACFVIVDLASTDLMPHALYDGYYVRYLLKTVPLIPLWIVMQGELWGWIGSVARSEVPEAHEVDPALAKPVA
ncbi:MAG TPA: glycosyltransferase family 87 protein [Gemmatimonadaceae bacterium]